MNPPVEDNTQLLSNRSLPPNQSCYGFLSYEQRITLFSICLFAGTISLFLQSYSNLMIGIGVQSAAIWMLYQSFNNTHTFALLFGIGMAIHLFGYFHNFSLASYP